MNSTIIIVIGSIIVAFIFITWFVRYINGLKKTRDYYRRKISEVKNNNDVVQATGTGDDPHCHYEDNTEKNQENDE